MMIRSLPSYGFPPCKSALLCLQRYSPSSVILKLCIFRTKFGLEEATARSVYVFRKSEVCERLCWTLSS